MRTGITNQHKLQATEPTTKAITKFGIAIIAINGLIGAGIFALPAAAANQMGFFSPWMFLLAGLAILPIVACFAILSSGFNETGGPIVYATRAFGPFIGFQTGWLLYLGRVSALAANGHALILYLSLYVPILAEPGTNEMAVCGLIVILAAINIIGVKNAMTSMYVVTAFKLLPILLFIMMGVSFIEFETITSARPPALEQFPTSMLLLVYAFIGFEGAVVPAGEAKKPKTDMPFALISTLVAATVLYVLIQAIVVSTLPPGMETKTPLASSANWLGEQWELAGFGLILGVTAIVSIFGNLLALMFAAPRMTFAMAENQQLPNWFAKRHSQWLTPLNSIVFLAGFAIFLAVTKGFVWLAIFSSLARLIGYLVCVCALPVLHKAAKFTQPTWLIQLLATCGLLVCIWLINQASTQAWLFTLAFIAIGSGLYLFEKWRRTPNS